MAPEARRMIASPCSTRSGQQKPLPRAPAIVRKLTRQSQSSTSQSCSIVTTGPGGPRHLSDTTTFSGYTFGYT
jgi:hypothetical protein